ncbi:GNAT family N-acetyltransferase [Microbacterium horticulturae]|uniref:GNAT family N-acetyltransferase n=1 Tax=Microbacterium horticulturae TaxID=3028316 RepID=A0ABY8C070_9MICO|nr:GNAT family N-acetyltransferase [Microbacterium sp. KACC 23027]WEG09849.1 GNAT family N-acetyltransferase [Microbacterium sp. KACC 23027]
MAVTIRTDDPTASPTLALVTAHLTDMHAQTPVESVHALGIHELCDPSIVFWSAWAGDRIAGIGALKQLETGDGEIKSMRVDDAFRGTGVGRAVLRHIISHAKIEGMPRLWLETGSTASFLPARSLYASEGFMRCEPFGDYRRDPRSVFMTRGL